MNDFQRKMRLYLIKIWNSPELSEDSDDSLTVSRWSSENDLLSGLHELKLVSSRYGLRNLEVDRWFIYRDSGESYPLFACSYEDPCASILFRVICQALKDVRTGRPCDLNSWDGDLSPDFRKCTKEEHICGRNAEEYLNQLDGIESLIRITPEFIRELVNDLKRRCRKERSLCYNITSREILL